MSNLRNESRYFHEKCETNLEGPHVVRNVGRKLETVDILRCKISEFITGRTRWIDLRTSDSVCSVIYTPFNSISITIKRGVVSILSHRSEDSMLSSKMPRSYLGSGSTKTLHPQCMLGYQHQTTLHSQHCHLYARTSKSAPYAINFSPAPRHLSTTLELLGRAYSASSKASLSFHDPTANP